MHCTSLCTAIRNPFEFCDSDKSTTNAPYFSAAAFLHSPPTKATWTSIPAVHTPYETSIRRLRGVFRQNGDFRQNYREPLASAWGLTSSSSADSVESWWFAVNSQYFSCWDIWIFHPRAFDRIFIPWMKVFPSLFIFFVKENRMQLKWFLTELSWCAAVVFVSLRRKTLSPWMLGFSMSYSTGFLFLCPEAIWKSTPCWIFGSILVLVRTPKKNKLAQIVAVNTPRTSWGHVGVVHRRDEPVNR